MLSFTKLELQRTNKVEFSETVSFPKTVFQNDSRINELKDVLIVGSGYYQSELDIFAVSAQISGIMIVPCARSLQEVVYPFSCDMQVSYSFKTPITAEEIAVNGVTVDLKPEIFLSIMGEVPLKVTAVEPLNCSGENWEVISEADYQKELSDKNDPRLTKLREFEFEDDQEE